MCRSSLTFEFENTEIKNAENGFFFECTSSGYNNLFCLSAYQFVPNRYFRVLKILDDAKQLSV